MQELRKMLMKEQRHLERIVYFAKANLDRETEGHLRISKDKSKIRYYHCTDDNRESYIPRSDKELPKKLAQRDYYLSVIKKGEARLKQIKRITKDYSDDEIEGLFHSLHEERKALVTPVEPTWEQRLAAWYAEEYQGKEFQEGTMVILSEKGERVRSKSEKILADFFYRRNILYKYEKPLNLKGFGTVYPDFTFLSKKTGQEIYWEHEGMMDKPEYARSAVRKIESYQKNEIYSGDRLILTFETEQSVLNTGVIEGLVKRYLYYD